MNVFALSGQLAFMVGGEWGINHDGLGVQVRPESLFKLTRMSSVNYPVRVTTITLVGFS